MIDTILAPAQHHDCLTVFPLLAREDVRLPYLLLPDALAGGAVTIMEVGSGTVPTLLARNEGAQDVLVVDGDQLVGAKQNRMANRSILLPAHGDTRIPVSCMEQGRWHFTTSTFAPADQSAPAQVRRHARRAEAEMAQARPDADPSDALAHAQGQVWASIREYGDMLGGSSHTGALNELYEMRAAELVEWVEAFPPLERQIGLLGFVGGRPLGLDVLGGANLYALLHRRLVRGYIMDALQARARPRRGGPGRRRPGRPDPFDLFVEPEDDIPAPPAAPPAPEPRPGEAEAYLAAVQTAKRVPAPTAGRGDYHVLEGQVWGGQLDDGDRLVHVSAFPRDA